MRDAHVQMTERLPEQRRERPAAAEEARKKAQREEEVEESARLRSQAAKMGASTTVPEAGAWRRPSAQFDAKMEQICDVEVLIETLGNDV